jgi:hypothetical protein
MDTEVGLEIKNQLLKNNCHLKIFTKKSENMIYICACGIERSQMYKDYIRRNCRNCNEKRMKDDDFKEGHENDIIEESGEIWKRIKGGWISSFGKCKNIENKVLTLCTTKYRYTIGGKSDYASRIIAISFKIENYEKIEKNQSNIVRFNEWYEPKDKSEEEYQKLIKNFKVDNLYIGTKIELGHENGLKSRHSEIFQEKLKMDINKYKEDEKIILKILPNYIICKDGNIYNGSRFLTGSKNEKYLKVFLEDKTYSLHRLVCIAFHPIYGKTEYEDYSNLQVNHINGEVDKDGLLSNHADNLEWMNASQNMMHSYENNLNKKQRTVLQFNKETKLLIKEYRSVAEASRETGEKEHQIREISKGKSNSKANFLWKYKDESKSEEFSKKYSKK